MYFHLALPDFASREGVKGIQVFPAEADAHDAAAIGKGKDHLGGAIVGAHLDAKARRDQHLAFARNFGDLARGIEEMVRVVRPGGRVVILEITTPTRSKAVRLDEVDGDDVVVRIQATPEHAEDGAKLADELMAALSSVTGEHAAHVAEDQAETAEGPPAAHTDEERRPRSRAERAWR